MSRFLSLCTASLILLCACPPSRPTPPCGTGGAGGSGVTSSTSAGASAPTCIEPRHRPSDYHCATASDCNTGTLLCEEWTCEKSRCIYLRVDDGAHCDPGVPGDWHWACAAGACCPRAEDAGAVERHR